MNPANALQEALAGQDSLLQWFAQRGYSPLQLALPTPRKELQGLLLLQALEHPKAPRFFLQWRDNFTERSVKGKRLRALQREANTYCNQLRSQPEYSNDVPDLFALGCNDFLLFFPLNGDVYARRLRFSPRLLEREGTSLRKHYQSLHAASMAAYAKDTGSEASDGSEDDDLDFLDDLLRIGEEGRIEYDFSALFIGEQLDEDFVALMSLERRELLTILLQPSLRGELLVPLLQRLQIDQEDWSGATLQPDGFPDLAQLVKRAAVRHRLIATVDTVLLRVVLYRYLEAQFGYKAEESETQDIAFGVTFDEILEATTQSDSQKLLEARETAASYRRDAPAKSSKSKKGSKAKKASKPDSQLFLFDIQNPPVQIHEPETFTSEVKERNEYYQRQSGGDLHHGRIAEAATFFQEYLLEHYKEGVAAFYVITRSDRYSFAYADLDPRAFQRFYENTIGTDIRILYQPGSAEARIDVVHWHQNRKEQGAYFTSERICSWLVERSLGQLYQAWLHEFIDFLRDFRSIARGRMNKLRGLLDRLLSWKIMDPTMGGGIFLRAAFEFLSEQHASITSLLDTHLTADAKSQLFEEPQYKLFQKDAEQGEWQWYILLHMLYGVDVDIKAVNIASNLLTLSALSYKPHGICFPSFINTNLKRGNAFVIPIDPERRDTFVQDYCAQIKELLALRQRLRDPGLTREQWRELHQKAHEITTPITNRQILQSFAHLFPKLSEDAVLQRVHRTGVFLYEIEFPEVFFAKDGSWKENPGFDVIIGNPPWEIPSKQLKHFLPEFDPAYRELSGPASKEREKELLKDQEISLRWEIFQQSIDDFRELLLLGPFSHQETVIRGKNYGIQGNLYQYSTELAWLYLRENCYGSLLLDSGLWNDLSATGLRKLLLEQARVSDIVGFVNHKAIFPDVHRSYKFSCNVFQKGGRTENIQLIFMREKLEDLERFDEIAFDVDADVIRHDPSATYAIPELGSKQQWTAQQALVRHPRLSDAPWVADILSEEFHAGRAREKYFKPGGEGLFPLVQGKEFNLFGVHQGALPEYWLDPSMEEAGGFLYGRQEGRVLKAIAAWLESQGRLKGGKKKAALAWVKAVTGEAEVPSAWVRLDWEGYRIAWRDITNRTNKRTLIAAILPPGVGVSDMAPSIRPFKLTVSHEGVHSHLQYEYPQLLYLAGVLSSFSCDSIARSRVAKTHLKKNVFENFNIPPWQETKRHQRIAELTGMLTCLPSTQERPWADYRELAAAVGLTPERDGLVDPAARHEAEGELNALVAELYGLGREEIGFLMNELFMTSQHREEHALMRDSILGQMED